MQMKDTLKSILRTRHYLVSDGTISENTAYYNAYLLANFGITVDKPQFLTKDLVEQISKEFHLTIPRSFYSNPQDMSLFTKEELLIEQIVSYFAYGSDLGRIEIFKKDFPEYVVGDELKLRNFIILTEESEADKILSEITEAYCAYTRPHSLDESLEFQTLFLENYYNGANIKCKDNIFVLLPFDASFARFLDKKDIVKFSIQRFGDKAQFKNCRNNASSWKELKEHFEVIAKWIPYVKHCPMSKKQAKYFNKIVSLCGLKLPKANNDYSPDRIAMELIKDNDIVGAAKVYAASGSMLERRLKMLLSRANPQEAIEILNMIPATNPIVLYQLFATLSADDTEARTFTYFYNNKVRTYHETDLESLHRKSRLNENTRKFLSDVLLNKIKEYYESLPSLGKVYVSDNFYKLGMPTNTSASGKGTDVLPTGSRVPCTGSKIRTFVHWKDAFDIDSSLIIVDGDGNISTMGWFNYSGKPFGNNILYSGDITGRAGAEFFDIDLDALKTKGCKYVVQTFHGFCSKLNSGKIYAGYQNKKDFNTKAWDPKNIEMQFRVQGDSRACVAFAIDIQNSEIVILNQIMDSDEQVVKSAGFKTIEKYLKQDYLTVNIGLIANCRGEIVDDPLKADIVLDDTYVQIKPDALSWPEQTIIRSWELEKLVSLINS